MSENIPFGPLWEQEMKQFTKEQLINKLRAAYIAAQNKERTSTAQNCKSAQLLCELKQIYLLLLNVSAIDKMRGMERLNAVLAQLAHI